MTATQHWDATKLVTHFRKVGRRDLTHSVLTDELMAAVVKRAFEAAKGEYFEVYESIAVTYDDALAVDLRAGGPRLSTRHLNFLVDSVIYSTKKYSISKYFVNIDEKYFQIFYNSDHAILHRLTGTSFAKLLDRENITAPSLRLSWSKENQSQVEIDLALDREVGERVAAHAASEGLDIEEWIRDAINRRLRALPEPFVKPMPDTPPNGEMYETRADKSEKAPDFIERVYGEWLTGDFTRADLRKLDEKAEMALRNWERSNGRADMNLPTIKERNDKLVAEGRLLSENPKETRRRIAAAANRAALNPE